MKFSFYAMNVKGYSTLRFFCNTVGADKVGAVICSRDPNLVDDCYDEMLKFCQSKGIPFFNRNDSCPIRSDYAFAVGWRWLIREKTPLIVTHDSLLPRYRGFAPLVNALINGERQVGVTALFASEEYDRGDIVAQESVGVEYPIKIAEAIDRVIPLFGNVVVKVAKNILEGKPLTGQSQNEAEASYSLWRGEDDYQINWMQEAFAIQRFIHAVGVPYKGAFSFLDGEKIRIDDAAVMDDVKIENRTPGKVIFRRGKNPVVVCGKGLLCITDARWDKNNQEALPLPRFRACLR